MKNKTVSVPPLDFRIINWIGIIEQLTSEKSRQLLEGTDVPPPQFKLLNHFSHRPDEGKKITQIAAAMQQPQPGITKTVAKMVQKNHLREEANPEDGRSKILFLTNEGIAAHQTAKECLIQGIKGTFDGWQEAEKQELFQYLDRLKVYFDNNR
ncbi:hypothetical protein A9Q83_02385 [Alphaproteobacteria bacterium 46_93_T64]|nr:hypothetical protein A9Q83_02385 [Alphaproteobacteria bacterium 46_93_T64]